MGFVAFLTEAADLGCAGGINRLLRTAVGGRGGLQRQREDDSIAGREPPSDSQQALLRELVAEVAALRQEVAAARSQ